MLLGIWERTVWVIPKKHLNTDSISKCLKISIWNTSVSAHEGLPTMGIDLPPYPTENWKIYMKEQVQALDNRQHGTLLLREEKQMAPAYCLEAVSKLQCSARVGSETELGGLDGLRRQTGVSGSWGASLVPERTKLHRQRDPETCKGALSHVWLGINMCMYEKISEASKKNNRKAVEQTISKVHRRQRVKLQRPRNIRGTG